jgi:hypothetical protein
LFYRLVTCSDDDDVKGIAKGKETASLAADTSTPLLYHGGPVMTAPVIYIIWYGNWTGNNGTTIIENFVQGLGSTSWWNITIQYNNTSPILYGGSTTDSYSQGTNLTTNLVLAIVQQAINSAALPDDTNGIYFVLASADCNETSFCTSACGWHTYSSNLKFAWVGNAEQICPTSCSVNSVSPNGNPGADAMVSVIAHEATETATDPYLNAWYGTGCADESADKCAYNYGQTSTLSNGAIYNIIVNGYPYLIQENWELAIQNCSMS